MPKHTIYTAMISENALASMGLPHQSGRAAMRMLGEEGFEFDHYIDIFDGGPTMIAATDRIRTIEQAKCDTVVGLDTIDSEPHVLASGILASFRSCLGSLAEVDGGVVIDAQAAADLQVGPGDSIIHIPR
jgi:arginine N-succinyltransferase